MNQALCLMHDEDKDDIRMEHMRRDLDYIREKMQKDVSIKVKENMPQMSV